MVLFRDDCLGTYNLSSLSQDIPWEKKDDFLWTVQSISVKNKKMNVVENEFYLVLFYLLVPVLAGQCCQTW